MNEYDVQDPYGTYDVGDELKPYEILNQMKSWDKEIRLTVSAVQLGLEGATQQQSQILLDIDSIELSVVDIGGRLGTAESTIELHAGQIALKATQAQVDDANARVTSAELLIDGLESAIMLKADSSITDGLNTRLGTAEVFIDGVDAKIALKADSAVTDGLNTRLGTAEIFIDGVDGKINAKASTFITDGLNTRLGSAEIDIDGLQSDIALKASLTITNDLGTRVGTAETKISGLTSSISSKASTTVTDDLGTRINTAEQDIDGLEGAITQKVSQTDYNGSTVWSMIAQNAYSIKLLASNIDLSGIVRVADSIELGSSGNGVTKAIKFDGLTAWIYSDGANLTLSAPYLNMRGRTEFYGTLDLRNQQVLNHSFSLSGHNHSGVYQPVGNYSVSGHDHGRTYVAHHTSQYLGIWHNGSTSGRIYNYDTRQYHTFTTTSGSSF